MSIKDTLAARPLRFHGGSRLTMGLVGSTGRLRKNDYGNHKGNNSKKNSQIPPSQQPSSPRELPKPDPNYSPAKLS